MLKIKDNVDLKELVLKYKFVPHCTKGYCWGNGDNWTWSIKIYLDRHIAVHSMCQPTLDMLYDLIKADLVEKVEAKRC